MITRIEGNMVYVMVTASVGKTELEFNNWMSYFGYHLDSLILKRVKPEHPITKALPGWQSIFETMLKQRIKRV